MSWGYILLDVAAGVTGYALGQVVASWQELRWERRRDEERQRRLPSGRGPR